jgi:hypothetical protein
MTTVALDRDDVCGDWNPRLASLIEQSQLELITAESTAGHGARDDCGRHDDGTKLLLWAPLFTD